MNIAENEHSKSHIHNPMLRFLVVEDYEDDAILLANHLDDGGFVFTWRQVASEIELTDALKQPWDIIFSDFTMPGFSGIHALEVVRKYDKDVPFIFVSGTIREELAIDAMKNGAQDFIMKGNTARLLPAIRRELQAAQRRSEARQKEDERARLLSIIEQIPDLVATAEWNGQLLQLNKTGRRWLDLADEGNIHEYSLLDLFPELMVQHLNNNIFSVVYDEGTWTGESVLSVTAGKEMPVWLKVLAHRQSDGNINYLTIIARDMKSTNGLKQTGKSSSRTI